MKNNNIYWLSVHDNIGQACMMSLVQIKNGRYIEPVTGYEFNNERNANRFGRYLILDWKVTPDRLATLEQCEKHIDSILDGTNETFKIELDIMKKLAEQVEIRKLVKNARRDFSRGISINSNENN